MKTKLKELRELIFKCEEVKKDACMNEHAQIIHQDHSVKYFSQYRSLNLEDVLRAFGDKGLWSVNSEGEIRDDWIDIVVAYWQLGKPLQFQSPECINSLIKLLK